MSIHAQLLLFTSELMTKRTVKDQHRPRPISNHTLVLYHFISQYNTHRFRLSIHVYTQAWQIKMSFFCTPSIRLIFFPHFHNHTWLAKWTPHEQEVYLDSLGSVRLTQSVIVSLLVSLNHRMWSDMKKGLQRCSDEYGLIMIEHITHW